MFNSRHSYLKYEIRGKSIEYTVCIGFLGVGPEWAISWKLARWISSGVMDMFWNWITVIVSQPGINLLKKRNHWILPLKWVNLWYITSMKLFKNSWKKTKEKKGAPELFLQSYYLHQTEFPLYDINLLLKCKAWH